MSTEHRKYLLRKKKAGRGFRSLCMWLSIGDFVSRRTKLFLEHLTLGLPEVDGGPGGSTSGWFCGACASGSTQLLVGHTDCRTCRSQCQWLGSDTKSTHCLWVCSDLVVWGCFGCGWFKLQYLQALMGLCLDQKLCFLQTKPNQNPNVCKGCMLREIDCVC